MQINVKIIEFTPSKTVMVYEPNKMYEDDIVTISSTLRVEANNVKMKFRVGADDMESAIKEAIPQICYNELIQQETLTFKELGMTNPTYETYDDGNGEFTLVYDFVNNLYSDIYIPSKKSVIEELHTKSMELYSVNIIN